jgi:hypothetical protein
MKEITNITSEGIYYIDEEGNAQFIDFAICHQNYVMSIQKSMGSRFTEKDKEFYKTWKSVGVRHPFGTPPTIWFYSDPPVKFEFHTQETCLGILGRIKKAGWRTTDGD